MLVVQVLGPTKAVLDGSVLAWGGPMQRAVLALLALEDGGVVSRGRLIDALWGARPPRTAEGTLQSYISRLRALLAVSDASTASAHILTEPPGYRLDCQDLSVDLATFRQTVVRGRRALADDEHAVAAVLLREALQVWDEPFADLGHLPFADEWRRDLEEERLVALDARIEADLVAEATPDLVLELQQLTEAYPYRERFWADLMSALYHQDRQVEALDTFARVRALFGEELGIDPGPTLTQMHQQVLEQSLPAPRPMSFGPPPPARAVPTPVSGLIGRSVELSTITALLERQDVRLVTLTGPGGSGKTRLAQEIASQHPERTVFVGLGSVADPDLVEAAIARSFEVDTQDPWPAVAARIEGRQVLLVLDDFEHLIDASDVVSRLLQSTPGLRILVTSRINLRLAGEHEVVVPPLGLPDEAASPATLASSPSVQLFLARAPELDVAARSRDSSTQSRALRDIGQLVRRLDGLPLAIELAAARTKVLPPAEILRRMDEHLDVLRTTRSDRPDRHRTLLATLQWSHELLPDEHRRLFRRLSVFPGPFSLDAAEAICQVGLKVAVLDCVELLADHSLLHRNPDGDDVRYQLLGVVRTFAETQLSVMEKRQLWGRHAAYCLERGEARSLDLRLHGSPDARAWFRRQQDDLRQALQWAERSGDSVLTGRLAAAAAVYWSRTFHAEGREWLRKAVNEANELPAVLRARLHLSLGAIAMYGGHWDDAQHHATAALDLVGEDDPQLVASTAHSVLGQVAAYRGDLALAEQQSRIGVDLAARQPDARYLEALANNYLCDLQLTKADFEGAAATGEMVLRLLIDRPHDDHVRIACCNLALARFELGDYERSDMLFRRVLALSRRNSSPTGQVWGLAGLAAIAAARGNHSSAAVLLAAAEQYAQALQLSFGVPEAAVRDRTWTRLQRALPADRLDALREEGRQVPLEDLVNGVLAGSSSHS